MRLRRQGFVNCGGPCTARVHIGMRLRNPWCEFCLFANIQEMCFQVACGMPGLCLEGSRDEAPTPCLGQG